MYAFGVALRTWSLHNNRKSYGNFSELSSLLFFWTILWCLACAIILFNRIRNIFKSYVYLHPYTSMPILWDNSNLGCDNQI